MKKHFNEEKTTEREEILIENINKKSLRKTVSITGVIDRIAQTGGPTIFAIRDGTGTISTKGFLAPGQRAYPELSEGDCVKFIIRIEEFNDEVEGEIVKVFKKIGEEKIAIERAIEKKEKDKATVGPMEFLVKSDILDLLKDRFVEAATQIRLAVFKNRPIIVRHHNDTDGYSAGFALERAILPLIEKQHGSEKAAWEFFTRAPCGAPYYEIDDSIRDTANSLRNVAKFSNKMPLIVIADNGSGQEDLMAIKQGKVHGSDFIVVDHHKFDKDVISAEVLTHINPFLVGKSGSLISAGMLCTELARFINPDVKNVEQIPALAGLADRIDLENPKLISEYLEIAKKSGYSKELLQDISLLIEYVSVKIRFMEVREYIEVIFGEPKEQQKKLVELLVPHIRELDKKGLEIGKSNEIMEKIKNTTLQLVMVDEAYPGFGFFPKPGRSISLLHEYTHREKKITNLISVGVMETAMTFRATDEANFSLHELIHFLNEKIPTAFIEGGGHKNAGAITYLPKRKEKILELVREFISKR